MPTQKTERSIGALIDMISHQELQLLEIKRGYKWSPQRAADLISSLYRGHPTEQLIFWKPDTVVPSRPFSINGTPAHPIGDPLYVIDGEQRLTALYRVLNDHPEAQVVFNCETQDFRIRNDSRVTLPWIRVSEITQPNINHYALVEKIHQESKSLDRNEIAGRLLRISGIRFRGYDIKILAGVSYEEVADICRKNHGGEPWTADEQMIATLAMHWHGFIDKLQTEATHWKGEDYSAIDEKFLARALIAVAHGDLSAWSQTSIETSSSQNLQQDWEVVQRGLRHLVSLLKNNLKIGHSNLLPSASLILLLPLIVLLGERPDERLDEETRDSLLYWLLIAIIRRRYKKITDAEISQDIASVRELSPAWGLHNNLGTIGNRIKVTAKHM